MRFWRGTGSEVTAIRPEFSTRQRMTLATLVSGACFQFPRVKRQVLAYLQLHSVDLSQKPGCREVIVRRIRLYLAQMSHLVLKIADPLEARFELLVTRNHGASVLISTIPRRPPPRFTCQNSTSACSSGHAARCRTKNTLRPKCAWAAPWARHGFPPSDTRPRFPESCGRPRTRSPPQDARGASRSPRPIRRRNSARTRSETALTTS